MARLVARASLEHPLLALLDLQVLVEHIGSEGEQDKVDVSLDFESGSENKEAATAAPQVPLMAALCHALRYLTLPWNRLLPYTEIVEHQLYLLVSPYRPGCRIDIYKDSRQATKEWKEGFVFAKDELEVERCSSSTPGAASSSRSSLA